MTITETNDDGEITILYDSRWQNPTAFGYKPEDPEYRLLRGLWEEATGRSDECPEPGAIWKDRLEEIGVM